MTHKINTEVIECPFCDFKTISMQGYKDHVDSAHVELAMFGHLTGSQNDLSQSFEKFKNELKKVLNVIIEDHNVIKQEMFILRQNKHESHEKLKSIENSIGKLTSMVSAEVSKPKTTKTPVKSFRVSPSNKYTFCPDAFAKGTSCES